MATKKPIETKNPGNHIASDRFHRFIDEDEDTIQIIPMNETTKNKKDK